MSAQLYLQNKDAYISEGNTKVTFAEIVIIMMKQRTGDKRPPAVITNIKTHPRENRSSLMLGINVLFLILK